MEQIPLEVVWSRFSATLPTMHSVRTAKSRQNFQNTGMAIAAIALLIYPVDWAFWRMRVAAGGGMSMAVVTATTAATLKGNRFEVYSQNTTSVTCSLSLLPQSGAGACWWLRRHPQAVTQY